MGDITRLSTGQIQGYTGYTDLTDNLSTLESNKSRLSYIRGQVNNATELSSLTNLNDHDQVYVKSTGKLMRYKLSTASWVNVETVDDQYKILLVSSVSRPSEAYLGQHIFETDTKKTLKNTGTYNTPVWQELAVGGDLTNLQSTVSSLESFVNSIDLTDLRSDVATLESSVASAQSTINSLNSAVTGPENVIKIVTSATRPATCPEGQHVYETDTNKTLRNIGSQATPVWEEVGTVTPDVNTIKIVTSNSRPSGAAKGQHIFETDTAKTLRNIGTSSSPNWEEVGTVTPDINKILIVTSTSRPSSPLEGQHIYETDTNKTLRNTGNAVVPIWEEVGSSVPDVNKILICTSLSRPSSPALGQHIFETDTKRTYRNVGTSAAPIWEEVGSSSGGAGGGTGSTGTVSQTTKLNVVGSVGTPYTTEITVVENPNYQFATPNVLKLVAGNSNVVSTIVNFDNSDASSFTGVDSQIIFDGTMRLKTAYTGSMTQIGTAVTGEVIFSQTIDLTAFKKIEKIEVY